MLATDATLDPLKPRTTTTTAVAPTAPKPTTTTLAGLVAAPGAPPPPAPTAPAPTAPAPSAPSAPVATTAPAPSTAPAATQLTLPKPPALPSLPTPEPVVPPEATAPPPVPTLPTPEPSVAPVAKTTQLSPLEEKTNRLASLDSTPVAATPPPLPGLPKPQAVPLPDVVGAVDQPAARPAPGTPDIGASRPPDLNPQGGTAPKPAAPGDFVTDFGPGNDLRFEQINPLATARLRQLQSGVDTAAGKLANGPDLTAAAQEKLRLLEEQSQPGFERALQQVGQKAAALGRLGAGMTTSELGDVTTTRERALSDARRQLASELAFAQGGENRANLSSLSGLEGQQYGQEAGQRAEVRGERGYQADTAQQAMENQIRQRALEEAITQGEYGRNYSTAELGLQGAGLQSQLAQGEQEAAGNTLSDLALQESLKQYGQRPGATAAAPAPTGAPAPGAPAAPKGFKWQNGVLVPLQPGEDPNY